MSNTSRSGRRNERRPIPRGILLLLQLTTAVVSALLDNVTKVLLVCRMTLAITKELDRPPYPFLFAEVFASNIGTATLIRRSAQYS